MSFSDDYVRQHIRKMPSYEPVLPFNVISEELGIPIRRLIKLDANENPYGPIPEVMRALSSLDTLHIYPDPESRRIRRLLAEYHQISEANIMARVTAAEQMVHGYLGVSSAQTVTDGIKTCVTIIATKLMQIALIEFGIPIEEDNTLDLVKMSILTILRNFLRTDVGVDAIPMSGANI